MQKLGITLQEIAIFCGRRGDAKKLSAEKFTLGVIWSELFHQATDRETPVPYPYKVGTRQTQWDYIKGNPEIQTLVADFRKAVRPTGNGPADSPMPSAHPDVRYALTNDQDLLVRPVPLLGATSYKRRAEKFNAFNFQPMIQYDPQVQGNSAFPHK